MEHLNKLNQSIYQSTLMQTGTSPWSVSFSLTIFLELTLNLTLRVQYLAQCKLRWNISINLPFSHPSRSICSLVLQTLRHSKLYTHILQRRKSVSHSDSYEHNNAMLHDHDSKEPIFGPNPQNASTPERQKRTQGNSLKGILINTNSVKSIEKATQLKATIHYNNPDIIFLVETKLDSNY